MANKDFLSSLSEDKKPDSFKEEERIKVEKEKSPILKYAVISAIIIGVLAILVYVWIVLIPHIKFNDFTNKKVEEVQAFLTQNKIETQGIVFFEEYNFDVEKGYIISQSVEGNKKIHKNEKIVFYVSKGADPEEEIDVPDLESMNRKQIETWINTNKLQGVKISTAYSNEVEKDEIISVTFKNDDRYSFKRGSQVTITFSKGEQPASTLKVIDLKEQPYSAAETFAKEKKLELKKVETTSTNIEKGLIISTSPAANENIKEGETLTVYVSKGIAVAVPDLVGKTRDDLNIFKLGDGKSVVIYEKTVTTNDKKLDGVIKEQNIKAGTKITDEVFVITIYEYQSKEVTEPVTYSKLDPKDLLSMTVTQANTYLSSLSNNGVKVEKENEPDVNVVGYKKGQIYYVFDQDLANNNYVLSKPLTIKVRVSAGEIYDLTLNQDGYTTMADLVRFLSEEGFDIEYKNESTYADATSIKIGEEQITYDYETSSFNKDFVRINEGQSIVISKQ